MKNNLDIPSNFLNKLIFKAIEPRTIKEVLMAFGIPTTIIFGSEFTQNPKIFSFNFLLLLVGMGLNICALSLNKGGRS
ncbi:hypothetical protein ACE38V_08360 [Cytobacillus sp. Hz8]|uniref:hypothetical protein n=1 Tax=Cytobacillus sp. Hz8 TaxID=3347168 RepID=UPI0035E244DF